MGIKGDRAVWEAESEGIELIHKTMGQVFDERIAATPDKEAVVYNYPEIGLNLRLNYRQYGEIVDRLARGLIALGVQKGDHIAVWALNVPEWVFLDLALVRIGAVMVTVNTAYKASEIEYVLRQGDIRMLFMAEEVRGNSYLESIYSVAPELKNLGDPLNERLQSAALPKLEKVILLGKTPRPGTLLYSQVVELADRVSPEELEARKAEVKPDDVAIIMYTSGTTGFPKGAQLTHDNCLNTMHINLRNKDYSWERYVSAMPLFHIAGANFIMWCIMAGSTFIPLIGFDPVKELQLLQDEKGTSSFCVPTMLIAMFNHPRFNEFDLSSLQQIYTGGTMIPTVLMEQVKEKMGADVKIFFGMTESAGASTVTLDDDTFELKSSTVGKAYPHMSIKIVEPVSGEPVGFGEKGELLCKGFAIMTGYYNMPEKTADAIDKEGWYHTGDLATMNEQGYVNIVGRVKDMVIRGGENIYPAEVEAMLMRHPKVADAQVIGLPDAYMGEELCALVRLKAGEEVSEDEIREFCKANISRYKVPKYYKFVTEYPQTASGKIKKYELRAEMIKEFGLEEASKVKTA
jgi:fatty-acyl-CoA synthase